MPFAFAAKRKMKREHVVMLLSLYGRIANLARWIDIKTMRHWSLSILIASVTTAIFCTSDPRSTKQTPHLDPEDQPESRWASSGSHKCSTPLGIQVPNTRHANPPARKFALPSVARYSQPQIRATMFLAKKTSIS